MRSSVLFLEVVHVLYGNSERGCVIVERVCFVWRPIKFRRCGTTGVPIVSEAELVLVV